MPTFLYTFHVSIYKHTAIRDDNALEKCEEVVQREGGLHFFMKLKGM